MNDQLKSRYWDIFLAANRAEDYHTMHIVNEECVRMGYLVFEDML